MTGLRTTLLAAAIASSSFVGQVSATSLTSKPNKCAADSLSQLNATAQGRVHVNTPLALPCFSSYNGKAVQPDASACATVQQNYRSATYRADIPGAYMNEQDEMCSSDPSDQCLLDDTNPSDPLAYQGRNCAQGDVPSYYLEVQQPCDVQAAFDYSKKTGTPLAIKNSGHDYQSRSSGKDSLVLWTRKMQDLEYHSAFQPEGCPSSSSSKPVQAITIGAGVSCGQAYEFAESKKVTILCGYSETVGMSGGWVQMGGHSVLSPVYGLGIDRVLQYKVVTPDGQYRVANQYQNQDLFWALRGGGGGTFGVVMESTHLVEPELSFITADISFPSNTTTLLEFFEILTEDALQWANDGWGGHITGSSIVHVNPLLSMAKAKKSTKKAADYAIAHGGQATYTKYKSFYPFFQKYILNDAVAVGNVHLAGSRLIPTSVLSSKSGRKQLMNFITNLVEAGGSPYVPVSSPHLYKPASSNLTSATPAWYSSLWEFGAGGTWAWNSTLDQRIAAANKLDNQTAALEAITPGGGAYSNEANPWTKDWQEAWWGQENYASLLSIKQKYDPDRLLRCWRCVGWEDSDVSSSCFSAFNN